MATQVERIRALNDTLRCEHKGGLVVVTAGIQALREDLIRAVGDAVADFDAFDAANDLYGEHDFGAVKVAGRSVFFKIDYCDLDMTGRSPDPADPTVTRRVLTIMLAEEY